MGEPQREPVIFTVAKGSPLAAMFLAGREALPLKFAIRANRAFSGEDFGSFPLAELRSAFLSSLNNVMEKGGFPLLHPDAVKVKIRPCGRDASGAVQTIYYALGVACTEEVAGFVRHHVETGGAGLPMDLGRSAPAHAMLYDGDNPADAQYHVDITADSFGKVGPELAKSMLEVQGFSVASVTEMAVSDSAGDRPLDYTAPVQYKVSRSVGRVPVVADQAADHVINRWARPATAFGDRRMVALVAGGHSFMAKTFAVGGRVRVQVEREDDQPFYENLRYWRMSATMPPRSPPARAAAADTGGSTFANVVRGAPPAQPAVTAAPSPVRIPAAAPAKEGGAPSQPAAPQTEVTAPAAVQQPPPEVQPAAAAAVSSAGRPSSETALGAVTGQPEHQGEVEGSASVSPTLPDQTPSGPSFTDPLGSAAPMDLDPSAKDCGHKRAGEDSELPRGQKQRQVGPQPGGAPAGRPAPDGPGR